jgi:hypothetical protein
MSVNFKNILIEATIDDMEISKADKSTLKLFNMVKDDLVDNPYGDASVIEASGMIFKVSEILHIKDYDYLYNLYNFYLKHKEVLFSEIPKEIGVNYTPSDYDEIVEALLLKYFWENYADSIVYEGKNTSWRAMVSSDNINEALAEEVYSIEFYNNAPSASVWATVLPDVKHDRTGDGIGIDYIVMDEHYQDFLYESGFINIQHGDIVQTGIIPFGTPQNLKNETLKIYFDKLIDTIINKFIIPNEYKINEYLDENE